MRLASLVVAGVLLSGCYECTQENCQNGCCSAEGVCIVRATTDKECGTGGLLCEDCTQRLGYTCVAQKCLSRCNATNCAGCCNGLSCVSVTQQSASQCGSGGDVCLACGAQQACRGGRCCGVAGFACTSSSQCCSGFTCLNGVVCQ